MSDEPLIVGAWYYWASGGWVQRDWRIRLLEHNPVTGACRIGERYWVTETQFRSRYRLDRGGYGERPTIPDTLKMWR